MFELEHTELSEKVYQLLKKMVLNREFIGGQRLDLNDLSQKMNISRTPLKDAVNRLVREGLMEVKPRSGTFVASLKTADIEEVAEIRLMIELWCMAHITALNAQRLAVRLEHILAKGHAILQRQPFSYQDFLDLDLNFHLEIVASGGNARMLEQYKSNNSFLYAARIYYFQSFERSTVGQEEHEAVVQALKAGDIAAVGVKLREHILNSKWSMIELLQKNGGAL